MVVAGAVVLVVVLAALVVHSQSFQRSALGWLSRRVEAAAGFSVEAESLSLRPLAGSLEIEDIRLRVPGELPFLTAERLRVRWRAALILRRPTRLELVELERPRFDAGAPLPVPRETDESRPALEELPVTLERLAIAGGEVIGIRRLLGQAPSDDRAEASISDLEVDASFDGRRLDIATLTSEVEFVLPERASVPLDIDLAGAATLTGAIDVHRFRLAGEALAAELTGRLDPRAKEQRAAFELRADPGVWLLDRPTGLVVVRGDLDLGAWRGRATVGSARQPAELLADLLPADSAAALEFGATEFELSLDFSLEPERTVRATAELAAFRQGRPVLGVTARPQVTLQGDWPAEVDAEAVLFPNERGRRHVEARLVTPAIRKADAWRIEVGTTEIEEPRLDSLLGNLARLYPRLLDPEALRDLPPLGRLSAGGTFGGAATDPRVDLRVELRPPRGGRVGVAALGNPVSGELLVETTGAGVELGGFTAAATGRIEWSGRVRDPLGAATGELQLSTSDLSTPGGAILDTLSADISGSRREIAWRLDARAPAGWRLTGNGTTQPTLPLARASGALTLATGDERIPGFDGSFELAGGALAARVVAAVDGRQPLTAELEAPLEALARIPQLAGLAGLPLVRRDGPLTLEWSAPTGSWGALVPEDFAERVGHLDAGTSGRLTLDPVCPQCSEGRVVVSGLDFELDGRRARAVSDLDLTLDTGRLRIAPWAVRGEGFTLETEADVELSPSWRPGDDLDRLAGESRAVFDARVDSTWLRSLPVEIETPGVVSIHAEVEGPLDALAGAAEISAPGLAVRPAAQPGLTIAGPEARLSLAAGLLKWEQARFRVGDSTVTSRGESRLEAPLDATTGLVEITTGLPVLEAATLPFVLRDGRLAIEAAKVETSSGNGTIRFNAPLDARLDDRVRLEWSLPANDWAPLLARLRAGEDPEVLEFATRGTVELSPARPALADARVLFDAARVVVRGRETRFEPALELTLSDGEARLAPFALRSRDQTFDLLAEASLATGWSPGHPLAELVAGFDLRGRGEIDAGLLNPLLAGGRAEGSLGLDIVASGRPGEYGGRLLVEGPEASLLFRSPYLARLERPRLELAVVDNRVELQSGSLFLNEGPVELSGMLWDGTGTDLGIRFARALFRLDYGLLATLGGDLRFRLDAKGDSTLSGRLDVERGSLTRDLRLDLDLMSQLLAPIDLTTTEEDARDHIALDLEVRVREGVRIKNNLADLLVRWEPLEVGGSLARPLIEGRLEVDPGGLLHLYGQTVRLDRAVIEYPGEETVEPRLELEATTSLEDPTINQLAGADPFREPSRERGGETPPAADVTADLARYVGEQLAGRIGESVGVRLSLRPLLIFGETDPGARLTVSRDLSPTLSVAASINLQEAEGQTYLLEVHELRQLPRLVAQAFTDDESAYGGALLERREFGGAGAGTRKALPRLAKLVVDPPAGVSKRGIRRALGIRKGAPFDPADRFLAEVELVDYLLDRGYPDARVSMRSVATGRRGRKVQLEIDIHPGPRVEFAFAGEPIPKPLRSSITSLYRPDFFEAESIEEMKVEAVRSLRSRGFLEPTVRIAVEPLDPASPRGDRRVTLEAEGGVRISPSPPVFAGVTPADAEALGAHFFNTVQRVELAVGLPSADRRLLAALADLGYPEAKITTRYEALGDRVLTVEIEPGPRRRVASVAIEVLPTSASSAAVEGGMALTIAELEPLLTVAAGDPLRRRELSRSAVAIERELGARGHLEARVRTVLEPATGAGEETAVRFVVDPGPVSRLAEVEFSGLRSTRERWARRVAELEPGRVLAKGDLAAARTRLWRTGLFTGITSESFTLEPGRERVILDLAERDRYRLTYGVRWDSENRLGAVFDASDDHFLGRGWTLGLRALYSDDEKSLRWLTRIPRFFGGPGTLDFFAARREVTETAFDIFTGTVEIVADILEGTLQYSHPLGPRRTVRVYSRYTDTTRPLPFITLRIKNPQLGVQFVYDSRPVVQLPERGMFASVDLSGSSEFLGGDLRYARLFSQLNLHLPLAGIAGGNLSWAQSFRLGLAEGFDQDLIREVRFFAGGEYSVRGYATESLGEQSRFGSLVEPAGGAALLIVNQELRWRLFEDYVLVLFVDAGNVWPEVGDLSFDLSTSAGIGLRASTPIGLLRADFAHALDRRPEIDPEFKFYIGLGTTF